MTWSRSSVRLGARAVAALVSGPLMIVAGGDDITAILAGIAGVALLALGVAVLWRTRRLDERPLRRYVRRALVAAVAAFAAVFVVMPVAFAIVANHKARAPVVRHGYGVLLLDRRGEGKSAGDFNARGWDGEPDLHAAIETAAGAVLSDHLPRRISPTSCP